MLCVDFEYDGQRLSDYGFVVCNISNDPGVETINIGSELTLNTVNMSHLNNFKVVSTKYNSSYSVTFQIMKSNCNNDRDGLYINEFELSKIMRWLNKKEYHIFKAIYENGEYSNVYYKGTFNVQIIYFCGNVIGLELTLQTNAPFGYYEPIIYDIDLSNTETKYTLCDHSDEIGFIYPELIEIKCLSPGDLIISNSKDIYDTVIRNCIENEIITLYGDIKQISSSEQHNRLYNDFNYNFIRIINEQKNGIDDVDNIFTSNIPCTIQLTYSPICKSGGII